VTGEVLLFVGAVFTLFAAVGVVRFRDVFTRAHAFTAGSTLGLTIALIGAAAAQSELGNRTTLVLAVVLQLLTSPLSSNLLSRASYLATGTRDRVRADGASVVETEASEVDRTEM
jgi:multicomponent Na+:H+ antiporter subunit G